MAGTRLKMKCGWHQSFSFTGTKRDSFTRKMSWELMSFTSQLPLFISCKILNENLVLSPYPCENKKWALGVLKNCTKEWHMRNSFFVFVMLKSFLFPVNSYTFLLKLFIIKYSVQERDKIYVKFNALHSEQFCNNHWKQEIKHYCFPGVSPCIP